MLGKLPWPQKILQVLPDSIFLINIFVSFAKLSNISLGEYSIFLNHVKSVFLMMTASEQKNHASTSFQDDHKLFRVTAKIRLV